MNIGLVGYGSIAQDHARAMLVLPRAEYGDLHLSAVMGPNGDATAAFARDFAIPTATTDLDTLLADPNLDAVIICSPSSVHAAQTERALRAGKHVLCEIPLALSLSETDHLIELAATLDRRLMVCHTQRYLPALVEARRRIATGTLHPHAIVSRYMFGRRENVNWRGRRRTWTDNLLWHHAGHAVDAALWLLGVAERDEQVETVAQVALPGADLRIPMDLALVMRSARDQIVTVAMSYHTRIPLHDYLIIGEETTLLFADGELRDAGTLIVPATPQDPADPTSAIARQDAEFVTAIREGREPAISARSVRPAMAALQQAQETLDARLRTRGEDVGHPRYP